METVFKKEIVLEQTLCCFIAVGTFIILIGLGGFLRISLSFSPVPLTLQTFFVLLSGALLGSSLGSATQLGYILGGLWGIPWFTNAGSGLFYLFGPTGGYILGFLPAAFFAGRLLRGDKESLFGAFVKLSALSLLILFCGIIYLKLIFGYPLQKLLIIGFLPFLPGDILKSLAAAAIYLKLNHRAKEILR